MDVVEVTPEAAARAAKAIRVLTVDAVSAAKSGHVGLPLGCAELAVVLFGEFLRHDPGNPGWLDRDRFVLSGGHGSMLLYALLHLSGYPLPMDEIRRFRQLGSRTPGHPEMGDTPGVETTTGPLGQGFGNAVGMALAERLLAARFGPGLVDHRTWVLASDGDMMEGVASEAASLAGHLGLGRLIVLYDDNGITIDGPTDITFSEAVGRRFDAYGWDVQSVDGHDPTALRRAIVRALDSEDRPHLIACRTHIGTASPLVDTPKAHGAIDAEGARLTRDYLGWSHAPFELPEDAGEAFRANARRGRAEREAWEARRDAALESPDVATLWASMIDGTLDSGLAARLPDFRDASRPIATRAAAGQLLNACAPLVPGLIGGSADLSGSTAPARLADAGLIERGKFDGRNLAFGVREHGMAAIANGMALHGGVRPFVGTFLVFSDYLRPSLRLSALMRTRVLYVFTHDSIFVGEDGPTHQPVEHVTALRAIPNLPVWRPADARETRAAFLAALERDAGPTAFALSRQGLPVLEADHVDTEARRGGYVLARESGGPPELVLLGTGSETHLALEAAGLLQAEGRRVRVVSVPCLEVFLQQDAAYRADVLGEAPRLLIEAGVPLGLSPLMRPGDGFHGLDRFGASAPFQDLQSHFGFTADRVAERARELIG